MANIQSQILPVGSVVIVNNADADERRGTVSDIEPAQYRIRFSNGEDEWLLPDVVRSAGGKSIATAAKWFGILTFLIGGGWWGLLFAEASDYGLSRRSAELALITAFITLFALILPTAILTRMARSRCGKRMWFNWVTLGLVGAVMGATLGHAIVA